MAIILQLLVSSLSVSCTLAQYSLWPSVNPDILAQSLGVSAGCLTALNETVSCDPTLFKRTKSVDYFFWTTDNVTKLCTSECQTSAASWNQLVVNSCLNETVSYNNKAVPADTISGRHVEGLNLACMTSSTGNSCMVDSQNWVGSGMIYNTDGTLADEQPLTQMYDNATLCDECFIDMMEARLSSAYVPMSSFNDYLGAELVNVLAWCGQNTTVSFSAYTSFSSATVVATSAASTSSSIAVPTCTGQVITAAKLKQRQLLSGSSAYANISQQCEYLSLQYNVPTGAVILASGNSDCNITSSICLPPACDLQQIGEDDSTCASLASQLDVAGGNVSTIQLLAWNPTIIGTCDNLQANQYVCISPPGGAWIPAIANVTNGTVGDSGGITQTYGTGTVATASPTNGIATPTPIQTGMTNSCDAFHLVESGDTCASLASEYGFSLDQFYAWNPAVGTSCLYLELGTYVCVDVLGSASSTTTGPTTTGSTITTPSPIQTRMVTDCDKFYDVQSGDYCAGIASAESIPLASLYAWNPAIGTSCGDLYLSYYVCIGVVSATITSSSPTSTSSSIEASVTPPAPTQSGIPNDCDAYAVTESGDGCEVFATRNGITLANLYLWNPVLDNNCSNFWSGEAYCIGVS